MRYAIFIFLCSLTLNSFAESKDYGEWSYSERTDDMTGEKIAKVVVDSNFQDVGMIFICKNTGLNALGVVLDEVFSAPGSSANLLFKVDGNKTLKLNGVMNGYKAIGLTEGFDELVRQMKKGKLLKVRAIANDYTVVNFTVPLNGFKEGYEKIRSVCK